jgi:bacterioferritin-associated ferredoxin
MYVCICNAIKEREFRAAAREHPGDAEAIYHLLGKPPQCRQCLDYAEQILEEERSAALLPIPILA